MKEDKGWLEAPKGRVYTAKMDEAHNTIPIIKSLLTVGAHAQRGLL